MKKSSVKHILIYLVIFSGYFQISTVGWEIKHIPESNSKQCVINLNISRDYFNSLDDINFCFFALPELLRYAHDQNLPVVLQAPKHLHGYGPLEEAAYRIEPTRTALTWARVFSIITPNVIPYTIEYSLEQEILSNRSYHFEYRHKEPKLLHIPLPKLLPDKKRYLITGGAGFIGSHLTKKLLAEGHQVIVLDNLSCCTGENIIDSKLNERFCFIRYDVIEPFDVDCTLDAVVHMASIPSPAFYYNMPEETLRVGLHGTKNCLELAYKKNARLLFTSTSEIYGDPEVHPQDENYAGRVNYMGKRSQYDQSKRGAELLCKYYYDHYKLDIRLVRIFNTYGPGMYLYDGRAVTNFIACILENKPMTIYGHGLQTRSFCYVDDTVNGIYRVLADESYFNNEQSCDQRVFNIGNPDEFTILELAEVVKKVVAQYVDLNVNNHITMLHVVNPDPSEPRRRCPDITRASNYLGYKPLTFLHEGIAKTFIYFYKKIKKSY